MIQIGTNLFDMRARDYTPATGQFLSNDPIGLSGGETNIRQYAGNNPVSLVDASGLSFQTISYGVSPGSAPPSYDGFYPGSAPLPTTAPRRDLPRLRTTAPTRERHRTLAAAAANDPSCYRSTTRAV